MKEDVLIVDDSSEMLEVLARQLESNHFNAFKATNVLDAVDLLKLKIPSLLITDIQMPGVHGGQLIEYCHKEFPELPILVITGYPSSEIAKKLYDSGIPSLTKPFTQEELLRKVEEVLNTEENHTKPLPTPPHLKFKGFIGQAESLNKTFHLINRTKDNQVTVLISGESGTGKELVARAIHYSGKYNKGPFIAVNCGAIPEHLLESELFGFVKGAFTGAHESRDGFFMAANKGTLFLDEIGNSGKQVQQSLLRAIQEKEIIPVGGRTPKKVDLRIIAATNLNLNDQVKKDQFREDLYYRLNVVNINLPPLRERVSDIPVLVNYFLTKYCKEFGKEGMKITPEALDSLRFHSWPGNVRELENVIQQAIIMADEEIQPNHLPKQVQPSHQGIFPDFDLDLISLKEAELKHIKKVLAHFNGNKTKAAKLLGITRKTLGQKLKNYPGN